jgi:hypothetical protein
VLINRVKKRGILPKSYDILEKTKDAPVKKKASDDWSVMVHTGLAENSCLRSYSQQQEHTRVTAFCP